MLQFPQAKRVGEGTAGPCEQGRSEKQVGRQWVARRGQGGPKLETQCRTGNTGFALFPTAAWPLQQLPATPSRVEGDLPSRPPPGGELLKKGR